MNYVGVSGGCDSMATALLLWQRGEQFELVFSDSGVELPEVYWLIPMLSKVTGKRLHVLSNGSYFSHLVGYDFNQPTYKKRWCTGRLKMEPQGAFFRSQPDMGWMAVGIRADEDDRFGKTAGQGYELAYPLIEAGYDKPDCKRLADQYGLLHPAYAWRTNVSCWCCPFQTVSDWRGLLDYYPHLYRIAEEWERIGAERVSRGYLFMKGRTLCQMRETAETQGVLL